MDLPPWVEMLEGARPRAGIWEMSVPFSLPQTLLGRGAQLKLGTYSDDSLPPCRGEPKTPSAGTGMQSWLGRALVRTLPCPGVPPTPEPVFSLQGRGSRVQIHAGRALSRTRLHLWAPVLNLI